MAKFFGGLKKDRKSKGRPSESDEVMNIGTPTNVKHEVHVGFDPKTGQFVGLPPVWGAWLEQSKIGPEEQKQNPNAVINALKTYENSLRHMQDRKYMGAESTDDLQDSGGESDKSRESSMIESPTLQDEDGKPDYPTKPPPVSNDTNNENDHEHNDIVSKTSKIKIDDSAKKTDGPPITKKPPTMRKKSMKRKKMTDDEIMAALKRLVSSGDPMKKYDIKKRVGAGASGTVVEATDVSSNNAVAKKKKVPTATLR